jgi:hypothetical protein
MSIKESVRKVPVQPTVGMPAGKGVLLVDVNDTRESDIRVYSSREFRNRGLATEKAALYEEHEAFQSPLLECYNCI